jgi:glycosyltransferase involved in cell wall biosynthesis
VLQSFPFSSAPSRTPDDGWPMLSVIVPVYNGGLQLSRCLEGIRLSEYRNFEVIVVDDCSTDNTEQIIERYEARFVRTPRTLGPAGARNMGIEFAQGRIVVFVDADVVIPPNGLGLIAQEFAHDSQLAAMFGSYDEEPTWNSFLSQYKNLMHCYIHQKSSEHATTFWAGCGAVRRGIFVEFGGFDHFRYREPSIEDIEFGYRLAQAGQQIRLDKRLQVKHLKKWTLRSLIRSDILCRAIPWTRLILETRRLPRDLNLTSGARVSTGLVGLLSLGWVLLFLQAANAIPTIALPRTLMAELAVVTLLAGLLVATNWDVYSFFAKRRGWWFAARVIPVHWFYYLYSGVVFITFGATHLVRLLISPLFSAARSSPTASNGSRNR